MIGTTHHSHVELVDTSLSYVKVDGNASEVPDEWAQRKLALGAVYDYDAKCHIHQNAISVGGFTDADHGAGER